MCLPFRWHGCNPIGTTKRTFPASPFNELYYFGMNNIDNAFQNATFSRATLPKNWTTVRQGCFADCANLTHVSLPNITSIGNSAFARSGKLVSLRIDSVTPPSIGGSVFYNCGIYLHIAAPSRYPTPGYIYVPDESVSTYKSTGNASSSDSWAYYRNFIKPLSEYPDN